MATHSAPTTFGASIVPTPQQHESEALCPPPMLDSPALSPATSRDDMDSEYRDKPVPPHSPFYQHPPASFERAPSRQASKTNLAVFEKDLESGNATPLSLEDANPFTKSITVDQNQECKMWPSKQTLMQTKMADKKKKRATGSCAGLGPVRDFWNTLDKRQKLFIKIAVALFLVGVAVAIGVGISKAVHGGVYSGEGSSKQIGESR